MTETKAVNFGTSVDLVIDIDTDLDSLDLISTEWTDVQDIADTNFTVWSFDEPSNITELSSPILCK